MSVEVFQTSWGEVRPKPCQRSATEAVREAIADKCDELCDTLLDKNRKYGNSALDPVRVFSRANALEQLRVRADDKLSRLASGQADEDEDVLMDLCGYLVLMMVAKERAD